MKRIPLLSLALLCSWSAGTRAAAPPPSEPRTQADSLVRTFAEKGIGEFLDRILAETAIGENERARVTIADTRNRMVRQFEQIGEPADTQYAGSLDHAPSLRTLCYVLRYRQAPFFFALRFYDRPIGGWTLLTYDIQDYGNFNSWPCADNARVSDREERMP